MDIPMIYVHDGEEFVLRPGLIEKLIEPPTIAILLTPYAYPGRYLTLDEAMSMRRINYATESVETLDKAIKICNLFNRVTTLLQPYIYPTSITLNTKDIWIDGMHPVIITEEESTIQEPELTKAISIFNNIRYDISTGRTIQNDLQLLQIVYNDATLADLKIVYSAL